VWGPVGICWDLGYEGNWGERERRGRRMGGRGGRMRVWKSYKLPSLKKVRTFSHLNITFQTL